MGQQTHVYSQPVKLSTNLISISNNLEYFEYSESLQKKFTAKPMILVASVNQQKSKFIETPAKEFLNH